MFNYDKFITDYNKAFFKNLESKKNIVIDAFIEYYGENYREKITQDINSVKIISFMPKSSKIICERAIRANMFEESLQNTYQILSLLGLPKIDIVTNGQIGKVKEENGVIKILDSEISEVYNESNEKIDELLSFIFGSTNLFNYNYNNNTIYNFFSYDEEKQKNIVKKIFKSDIINPDIINKIKSVISYMDNLKARTHGDEKYITATILYNNYKKKRNNNSILKRIVGSNSKTIPEDFDNLGDDPSTVTYPEESYIALPIFITRDDHFIHEMNHVVTSSILATIDEDYLIEKTGIDAFNTKDIIGSNQSKDNPSDTLGELINDRMAQDITNIIHKKGTYIFDEANTYDIPMEFPYKIMLPLIEDFYQKYKDLLKEVNITNNQRLLYTKIDKEALKEFRNFIAEVYVEVYQKNKKLTKEQINKAKYYTKRLERKPYEMMDSEEYLKELETNGYKITRLNKKDGVRRLTKKKTFKTS